MAKGRASNGPLWRPLFGHPKTEFAAEMSRNVLLSWPRPFDESPLRDAFPELNFTKCALGDPDIFKAAADADIWIAGGPAVTADELAAAQKLEWIQFFGAGLSPALFQPKFRDRGVLVSNAKGVNVINMGEHVIMMMLAFGRGLPTFAASQAKSHWVDYTDFPPLFELHGQTIGIVGFGAIGAAVAERARGMGMKVWATRRSPTSEDLQTVDKMFRTTELEDMLSGCDHVVLSAPLTDETRGMIGIAQFAAMKPESFIYNIGRGPLIDAEALIAALSEGQIAGAGLDVTHPEPLPPESPLWSMPNVIITPHAAGITPKFFERTLEYVADNMRRHLKGEQPVNVIDLHGDY